MDNAIHGLELVKEDICERFTSGSQISVDLLRIDKAITMMKEQEAVKPTCRQGKAYCGSCGKRIPQKIGARYCHKCGKPIKWECGE